MAEQSIVVSLGGRELKYTRARLGGFIKLQRARDAIHEAAKTGDNGGIVDGLYDFLTASGPEIPRAIFETAPWWEIFEAYTAVESLNVIPDASEFSLLKYSQKTSKRVPWDNPLRSTIIWIHLIASEYGWSREEIENLWPEEAVAYVMEILVDQQQEREFIHSLSELAYSYNKTTKKSRYEPLPRPQWMIFGSGKPKDLQQVPDELRPKGVVIYPKGDEHAIH